ncbi:glycosyltransferase family 8 protein [Aphanothece sacrum]|uniref:Glycosyl transferase n=1 Tax=Aphanothece sacrum FPU1 TaxID=1920663 RepID=A0A401IJL5_APHSA|nr:glycosyltransferase family 8 protein [Aphanothece sacrum]GBF81301.1 glycosyl transferase [Aphanothece sacrum FPU1]GBF83349.1 glycosyl transferase [Aphanothece sacrum FPU3]
MNILFCFDQQYEQHFGVALTSLILNNSDTIINLYIITDIASKKLRKNLGELNINNKLNFFVFEVTKEQFANLKISSHISEAAYYRLMVGNILPDNVDKILYLDSDLVVLNSLTKLYDLDIEDYYIAAYGNQSNSYAKQLKLNNNLYFNSGVMLINLKKWREHNIGNQSLEFAKNNPEMIKNWDQDALNKIVDGNFLILGSEWNFLVDLGREKLYNEGQRTKNQTNLSFLSTLKNNVNIIHFVGSSKPWFIWINNEKKMVYWYYLKHSLWSLSKPQLILIQMGYLKKIIVRKIQEYLK